MAEKSKPAVPETSVTKTYTVSFGIGERLRFAGVCPIEGSLFELEMGEDLKQRVSIQQRDYDKFGIQERKDEKGNFAGLNWSNEVDVNVYSFKFTKTEVKLIKDSIQKLSEAKKLNVELLPIVRKINAIEFKE